MTYRIQERVVEVHLVGRRSDISEIFRRLAPPTVVGDPASYRSRRRASHRPGGDLGRSCGWKPPRRLIRERRRGDGFGLVSYRGRGFGLGDEGLAGGTVAASRAFRRSTAWASCLARRAR